MPGFAPLKVLLFIQSLELGGSEKQCVLMARLLAGNSHDVTVGCMRKTGPLTEELDQAGIELVEFHTGSMMRAQAYAQMSRLARYMRHNRFDVVHANDRYSNLFAVPAAKMAGVPVIVSSQRDLSDCSWYTPARRRVLRAIQNMADCVIVNSNAIRAQLIVEGRIKSGKIRVIYNGIDVDRYGAGWPVMRPQIPGIPSDARLIAMVGNMHRKVKGHPELIAAARVVCSRHPDVRFVLIGDGEMRGEFERQVQGAGLGESIAFLGHRTDVSDILKGCEIGVLASHAEGLPNAVMEYMAAGLATIATAVGGVPELIDHEVSGLLIPPSRADVLAQNILDLLEDNGKRLRLAQTGLRVIREKCSLENVLNHLQKIYQPARNLPLAFPSRQAAAAD